MCERTCASARSLRRRGLVRVESGRDAQGIAYDGRAAPRSPGFRKRVAYLDAGWLAGGTAGAVVDQPTRPDLLRVTRAAHRALATLSEELVAESALVAIAHLSRLRLGLRHPPHRYAVARRVDVARRLLVDGASAAAAAAAAGFHDQAHLTRHFRRVLGTTPAQFVRSGGPS